MADASPALAKAVLTALATPAISYTEGSATADVTVHQRVPDEFTNAQTNAVIVVASVSLGGSETKGQTPVRATVSVQTLYRGRSMDSLRNIMAAIDARLDRVKLAVTGFTVSDMYRTTSDGGGEADEANLVHTGRQSFEVIIL
jgi:hypothetical protein